MRVLGIDPGLAKCGLALYVDGHWSTETVRSKTGPLGPRVDQMCAKAQLFAGWHGVDIIVIENNSKHSSESDIKTQALFDIMAVGWAMVGRVPHTKVIPIPPSTWKGQVPKKICHARIRKRLPDLGSCSMDAMDAVGLVLYGLDRSKF